jgi:hypothetical protein
VKTTPLSPARSKLDHTDRKLRLGQLFPKNQSIVNDRIREYHRKNRVGTLQPTQYPKAPASEAQDESQRPWTPSPIHGEGTGTGLSAQSKKDSTRLAGEPSSDSEVSSVDSEAERIKMVEYEEAQRVRQLQLEQKARVLANFNLGMMKAVREEGIKQELLRELEQTEQAAERAAKVAEEAKAEMEKLTSGRPSRKRAKDYGQGK